MRNQTTLSSEVPSLLGRHVFKGESIVRSTISLFTAIAMLAAALGCSTGTASNSSSYPPPQSYPPSDQNYPSGPTVASTGSSSMIPAGTQLDIRTNERIDARDGTSTGRDYDAEVANDIVNERGDVLVPRGSDAQLSVFRADNNELVLGVRSLEVNGRRYSVQSGDITREGNEGLGANRTTAKHVGGGALLGTLVGAVAGGAKGAAVGAAVGAAGGAAVQVLTKGREVNVPAETILTFRLDEPLRLYEYSGSDY
jgi:hypothetical protein